jgi:hypothetical protein
VHDEPRRQRDGKQCDDDSLGSSHAAVFAAVQAGAP